MGMCQLLNPSRQRSIRNGVEPDVPPSRTVASIWSQTPLGRVALTRILYVSPLPCATTVWPLGRVISGPVPEAWTENQHTNTATATSSFTDTLGNTENVIATDDANYFGAVASYTTEKQVSIDGGTT